ncbi:MAG: T9SS type A sorting domain-containing protein, partial [Flavisolibacter sp.]
LTFGDLVIYGLTTNTDLNGKTVREFLDIAKNALGGASTPYSISDLDVLASDLASSFANGPSTFAQQHLKKGWKSGDVITYNQVDWGNGGSGNSTLLNNYSAVYAATGYQFAIGYSSFGAGFTATWTDPTILSSYLPTTGTAAALNAIYLDATSTSSGVFGGDVAALKLDIDFSDAGFLTGSSGFKFGDLSFYDLTTTTVLNGMTIRDFLPIANDLLAGFQSPTGLTISDIDPIVRNLYASFRGGVPTTWAQTHLRKRWADGDMLSYVQSQWGNDVSSNTAASLLEANFNTLYAIYFQDYGTMTVGSSYVMSFGSAGAVEAYLPQSGAPGPLDASLSDPTFSNSGSFGGDVVTMKLNVDFADAGYLKGSTNLKFGDLTLCNTGIAALDGATVRQFLAAINSLLGTSGSSYGTISDLQPIAAEINGAFIDGIPSLWAQDHLVKGACVCGNLVINHCPTAASFNVSTTVGTQVKFILQGSDADNNTLTYTISQSPTHGTAVIAGGDSILYTPAAGYHGADQLKYKVSDGQCEAEGAVNITVIVCPGGQGYWKNTQSAWPVSSLMLGANCYTKSQLITILNTPVGTGNNADASLILAYQLIAAKLSLANGSPDPGHLADSIAAADALIGTSVIPMKVKANSPLGKKMISLATYLSTYNSGSLTTGCSLTSPITMRSETEAQELNHDFALFQNHPNPFNTVTIISYQLPFTTHVQLNIYNTVGQEVMKLVDEVETEGTKTVQVNASGLSKGIYYYRLTAGTFSQVRKMMVVR